MAAHLKPRIRTRRKYLVGVGLIVCTVLISAGAVFAFFSALGTGDAVDQAVTEQTLTVAASASPTADLYPGGSGALQFSIDNTNPYPVTFTSVSYGTVTSSLPTGCPASEVTPASGGTLTSSIPVPPSTPSTVASIPDALTMSTSAPDACQGVTFTVAITLTGTQSS